MSHYTPPAPAPGAYQQAVFTSPIPVTPTHLGHALASEWTKIRTVRSTMWTLGVMLLLVVGLGLLMTATVGQSDYRSSPILSFGVVGVLLGQLCVVALGVLVITSEYATGMVRTTFTACPQRARVLTAKAIVFFTVTLVLCTVACSLVAFANWASLGGRHKYYDYYPDYGTSDVGSSLTSATGQEFVRASFGAGLFMALVGLMSLAVGVLLRHTAGAIATVLGVVLLPLLVALFIPGNDMQEKLIEYSVPNTAATLFGVSLQGGGSGWGLLALLGLVTFVILGAAYTVLQNRDV